MTRTIDKFLQPYLLLRQQYLKENGSGYDEESPLTMDVLELSRTGNLTLIFSNPVITPPIQVIDIDTWHEEFKGLSVDRTRRLQETDGTQQISDLEKLCAGDDKLPVMCYLNLTVQTDFYDEEESKVKIARYDVTRSTSTAIDIQIEFTQPQSITVSSFEPDLLEIDFLYDQIFIDERSFAPLDQKLEVDLLVPK